MNTLKTLPVVIYVLVDKKLTRYRTTDECYLWRKKTLGLTKGNYGDEV